MPLISVTTNQTVQLEGKTSIAELLSRAFVLHTKSSREHIHVHVLDGQFLSYGGDSAAPAAYVIVRTTDKQITSDSRKKIMLDLVPALKAHIPDLKPEQIFTVFEERPVEQFVVGNDVRIFEQE